MMVVWHGAKYPSTLSGPTAQAEAAYNSSMGCSGMDKSQIRDGSDSAWQQNPARLADSGSWKLNGILPAVQKN